jgi:hypothetical protein
LPISWDACCVPISPSGPPQEKHILIPIGSDRDAHVHECEAGSCAAPSLPAPLRQAAQAGGAEGLLQDPGRPQDRDGQGHQVGIPQAGDAVAPGQDAEPAGVPTATVPLGLASFWQPGSAAKWR